MTSWSEHARPVTSSLAFTFLAAATAGIRIINRVEFQGFEQDGAAVPAHARHLDTGEDFSHPSLPAAQFELSLVENRIRFAAFAKIVNRAYPPGTHFNYSTLETTVLGWVLERATRQSISQYMDEHLWKRAGMESYGFWIMDGPPPVEPGSPLGYQYQWWTIAGTNAYTAIGLQGQFIYVDPDTDTVVVKLSYFPPGNSDVERESLAFLQAAAKWNGHD
ncbi:MAG: serine hydrolase [Steroidobacteraceae bacterium]